MKHKLEIERCKIIVFAQIKGINDDKKLKFILDTGASKTIIDEVSAFILGYDLKKLDAGDRLMTAGGGVNSKVVRLPKFSLFGKDMINFKVSVLKMPPQITYFVDGIVGMDFLLQFKRIKFDFAEKTVEI